jgi:Proteasome maturation factor UMP1
MPVWRGVEMQMASIGEWRPTMLGGGTPIHSDILAGRDWECSWEDVFKGKSNFCIQTRTSEIVKED